MITYIGIGNVSHHLHCCCDITLQHRFIRNLVNIIRCLFIHILQSCHSCIIQIIQRFHSIHIIFKFLLFFILSVVVYCRRHRISNRRRYYRIRCSRCRIRSGLIRRIGRCRSSRRVSCRSALRLCRICS